MEPGRSGALTGHEYLRPVGTHLKGPRDVPAVPWPVVSGSPQHGSGGGLVGDRGVITDARRSVAPSGHEHRRSVRAHLQGVRVVLEVPRAVVSSSPQPGPRGRVIGDGGVVVVIC